MARVLIAARLSRATGEVGRIERDDESARKWAEVYDHQVVDIAADHGVSGSVSVFDRPTLGPWLADPVRMASYDVIVASTVDRLGRNARDNMNLRQWAEDNGKQLVILQPSMTWPVPSGDFTSALLWDLTARFAEMELQTITKRHADARIKVRENGGFVGKPPFAFEVTGEKYARTLVPVRALVPVLHEMIRRATAGDTLLSIARYLDAEGIETPHKGLWSPTSVKNVLSSPALKGRQIAADGTITHKHDGIMSATEWDQLQTKITRSPGRKNRNTEETAMLTGSIRCALCEGPMYRIYSATARKDGSKHRIAYYRCKGSDQAPSTCRNQVRIDDAEDIVNGWFEADTPFGQTEIVELVTVTGDNHESEIAEVTAEIKSLDLDSPDYLEQQSALMSERKRLQEMPATATVVEERPTGQLVADVWQSLDQAGRRRYLTTSGVRVMVRPCSAEESNTASERHNVELLGSVERLTGTLRGIAA